MLKTRKHFLKVVQGYSLSPTSNVAILPIKIRGYNHSVSILAEFQ